MKRLTRTIIAFLSFLLIVTGCDSSGRKLSHDDVYALVNSLARGDAATTAALFTKDAAILAPNRPEIQGTDAIRAYFDRYMAYIKHDYSFRAESLATEVDRDLAVDQGNYTVRNVTASRDVESGKYVSVFRRDDGKWKIWRTMWSPNTPVQSILDYTPPS